MRFVPTSFYARRCLVLWSMMLVMSANLPFCGADLSSMNAEGGPYVVANSKTYDTEKVLLHEAEYFDIFSNPIRTLYSEVHWRMHTNISLPSPIVERFRNKAIAVVGYEVDQIQEGTGMKIPITWAYNHHYSAFLSNSRKIRLVKKKTTAQARMQGMGHGGSHFWGPKLLSEEVDKSAEPDWEKEIPHVQFFSEANGGEMRKSYHGYPRGYAQLVQSPDTFSVIPMQIDTWDRANMKNATYVPGAPRPLSSPNTRFQASTPYNTLLECPCSNRLTKEWNMSYALSIPEAGSSESALNPACVGEVEDYAECFREAMHSVVPEVFDDFATHSFSIHNDSWPTGCSVLVMPNTQENRNKLQGVAVWNPSSKSHKGESAASINAHLLPKIPISPRRNYISFAQGPGLNVTVRLTPKSEFREGDETNGEVTITLVGPADMWFGVGIGSNSMCKSFEADECPSGGPYAILVLGENVEERKLEFHGPGRVLKNSLTTVVNRVEGDKRIVVLKRAMVVEIRTLTSGEEGDYYSFPDPLEIMPATLDIPIIMAQGCSEVFAQHCGHAPSSLVFLPTNSPATVCRAGIRGFIGGDEFNNNRCGAFPLSTLVTQANPTCQVQTYIGGLACCRDGHSLLDIEQEQPWPGQYLEYRLKFRFYFQEYKPESRSSVIDSSMEEAVNISPASHKQLVRLYHQTEAWAGEYDIPMARKNVSPEQHVHVITSRWKVKDMLFDCDTHDATICTGIGSKNASQTSGIKLIYAAPHCHAGTCLSMELYNADTGKLVCGMEPIFGKNSSEVYGEENFLALPPCLWSETGEDGLPKAELLTLETNLWSVKRSNSTFPHTGEMASWQMRGILVAADDGTLDLKTAIPAGKTHFDVTKEEREEAKPIRPLLRSVAKRDDSHI